MFVAREMKQKLRRIFLRHPLRCLGDVWQVSGSGLEGVRKGSGMCQIFWTTLDNSLLPFLTSVLDNHIQLSHTILDNYLRHSYTIYI